MFTKVATRWPRMFVVGLIVVSALAVLPFAHAQVTTRPDYLAAICSTIVFADLLTAVLLAQQFVRDGSSRMLGLSCTYFYSGCVVIAHALSIPGVLTPKGVMGTPHTTPWLWLLWHLGFPIGLMLSFWGGPRRLRDGLKKSTAERRTRMLGSLAVAPLLVIGATWAIIHFDASLPILITPRDYGRLARMVGPEVIGVSVLAVLIVTRLTWRMRRGDLERWLPVVAVSALADVLLNLSAGGNYTVAWFGARLLSLLTASVVLVALIGQINGLYRSLNRAHRQLQHTSRRDPLTGLVHRGAVVQEVPGWLAIPAAVHGVAMLDIDHFKQVNDTHGHPAGDAILVAVANVLSGSLRGEDLVGRYGGEEFVMLLSGDSAESVRATVERCLQKLRGTTTATAGGPVTVTASAGLALLRTGEHSIDDALLRADEALYRAKQSGRDRLELATAKATTKATPDQTALDQAAPPTAVAAQLESVSSSS
jgi:diguanylate cyclase (GGDEF)-like protein